MRAFILLLANYIRELHDRAHDRIRDETNQNRHRDDDDWFNDFIDSSNRSVNLFIVEIRDLDDDGIDFCSFFTHFDHLSDHIRKERIAFERFPHSDTAGYVITEEENPLAIDFIPDGS